MNQETEMDRKMLLKYLNNNVLSQVISDSKKHLFAGNRYGDIFVLNIDELETTEKPCSKLKVFHQGEDVEINSLCFYRKFLIVGSIGVIFGLEWDEDNRRLSKKRCWEVKIPMSIDAVEVPDVNFMWLNRDREILFAGCGDNNIYQVDLEDGRIVRTYSGHTDYIHGVVGDDKGHIYSASEDGTVLIWNERSKESTGKIEISTNNELMRPELGDFIGAVAVKDDWLICGGGPKLSMWHLNTLKCAQTYDFPQRVHVCDFVEGEIVVGGEYKNIQIYSFNGEIVADIPVDHTAIYSLAWQLEPLKFMSIAGYDNQLHIMKQFRFLDVKIPLYGNTVECNYEEKIADEMMEDDKNGDGVEERTSRF